MKKKINYGFMISFSLMFGVICFVLCLNLTHFGLALALGAFTFAVFFLVFFIYMKVYMRGYRNISIPETTTKFKEGAHYYTDKSIGNGTLLLTDESLYFFQKKRGELLKTQIPLEQIENAYYDNVFRHKKGVKIKLEDGTTVGFTTPLYQALLDQFRFIAMKKESDKEEQDSVQ